MIISKTANFLYHFLLRSIIGLVHTSLTCTLKSESKMANPANLPPTNNDIPPNSSVDHRMAEVDTAAKVGHRHLVFPPDDEITTKYSDWKELAKSLYEVMVVSEVDWPSQTVDWSEDAFLKRNRNARILVIGTLTKNKMVKNYLKICEVSLPFDNHLKVRVFINRFITGSH